MNLHPPIHLLLVLQLGILVTIYYSIQRIIDPQSLLGTTDLEITLSQSNEDVVSDLTLKRKGNRWTIWDGKEVLHIGSSNSTRVCEWATFRYKTRDDITQGSIPMCVHKSPDVLSDTIRERGTWDECGRLVDMWNYELKKETNSENAVFVDIGANIGSCVLQMLLETDAIVMAFEPNPRNLFPLTSTLRLLPRALRNRVNVFPIGIGEARGSASISNDLRTNAGATMLRTQNSGVGGVAVEPLDSILASNTNIRVIKIDVQGFECKVLRGMKNFLSTSTISSLFTEVEDRYLKAAGCTPKEMFNHLKNSNFSIYEDDSESPIFRLSKIESPLGKEFYNIIARVDAY